jgi:hypothetical protein
MRAPNRVFRVLALAVAGAALLLGSAACTITPQPDEIVLHYKGGPFNGNKFDRVIDPGGQEGNMTVADSDVSLPTSLRTWNIAADDGADQTEPIVVPTSDGVLVHVWLQANFVLNSNYEDIDGYDGGTVRKFWEEIGRRYGADSDDGWRSMMLVTVVPALEKATTDTVRSYAADPLVYNTAGIYSEVQEKIGDLFLENLVLLSGGNFFCGPTFVRGDGSCPPPELILRDIDFSNPEIQAARDQRRTQQELAQARVEEAEGHLEAQKALAEALADGEYLAYLRAQMELEAARAAAEACAMAANCTVISGGGATPVVPTR